MGFWGIEVKPGKPHPYHSDNVQGRLYVTQATLGLGSSKDRSILQCSVGHKSAIFLCSLLPGRSECCSLNLEFTDELVAFSVIGNQSIHLSGYFVSDEGENLRDEYNSDSGEDIAYAETDESSDYATDDDYSDEYDDFIEFDDDDAEMFSPSHARRSGVVIEEIVNEDKPTSGNEHSKRSNRKKNDQSGDDKKGLQRQIVLRGNSQASVLESEDEDGFPLSASQNSKHMVLDSKMEDGALDNERTTEELVKKELADGIQDVKVKKRKVTNTKEDIQPEEKKNKKKKKKIQKGNGEDLNSEEMEGKMIHDSSQDGIKPEDAKKQDSVDESEHDQRDLRNDVDTVPNNSSADKKKKKKNKKKKSQETEEGKNDTQTVSGVADEGKSSLVSEEKHSTVKSSQVRTFPNGLIIEQLAMGIPDGKRASDGSRVSVCYIGKLKKNSKIFDSNVGRAPFTFRLGIGEVIKGWDVGVKGMRVGDKRRLTIPPSMGYGAKGAGGKIPPNAWLEFDVELVNVR